MDIVLNIDDGYAQHCAVMLVSLFENNMETPITVHLMSLSVSENNKSLLRSVVERYNNNIQFYDIDMNLVVNLPNLSDHYISPAAYIRLFIQKTLPTTIKKVLYIDCDIIVRGSVEELWNVDIQNYAVAAVEDTPGMGNHVRLGYDPIFPYFNSGVLLLNMEYWRDSGVQDELLSYLGMYPERIVLHDQDVLNAVLHDRALILSNNKWNVMDIFFQYPDKINARYASVISTNLESPIIVHFSGGIKPWHCWINNPFQKDYYYYLSKTPWAGYKPTIKTIIKKRGLIKGIANITKVEKFLYRHPKLKRLFKH